MVSSNPVKVLHICQRDDAATGGAVRVAVEYVKRLPTYGVDAHCLFLYGSPGPFQQELGCRAHYLGLHSSRDILNWVRLPQFIQQFCPDILHHHDGLLWPQILTLYHPNIVKIVHGHLTAKPQPLLSKAAIAARLQRQSTDVLVAITEDTRQSFLKHQHYAPEQVVVIYNGVDLSKFYPPTETERFEARRSLGLPAQAVVVGFVGRLHCAMKGTDDFLRVISCLPPDYWGLVVGTGPDLDSLKVLAVELGIENRVVFTGLLEHPALAYQAMTTLCLTSHNEPFGLVVAEAMAAQVPVVGFACEGGVKELLTPETGVILEKRDAEEMAKAIKYAVDFPDQGSVRCINAHQQVTLNHNWDVNAQLLSNLYFEGCLVQTQA